MRIRLALPLMAIAGALFATAPATANPVGATGQLTKATEVNGKVVEEARHRHRHWRRYARHHHRWRPRYYAYRPYYYRPYYYPYYYSYAPYGYYPYYGRRRHGGVSIYLNF